jgi:hypothetical protein
MCFVSLCCNLHVQAAYEIILLAWINNWRKLLNLFSWTQSAL